MKKLAAVLLAGAVVASGAFAEFRFSGFGRANPVVVADNGDDIVAGRAIGWGSDWGGDFNLGFVMEGRTNNCGFFLDIGFVNLPTNDKDYEKNYAKLQMYSTADQAKIWVKPFDMLTINAGRVLDKSLRGDLAYGMFDWLRTGAGRLGEGLTFSAWHKIGLELVLKPIEGVTVFGGMPLDEFGSSGATLSAEDCYKQTQAGAAYDIANIGLVRAQYIGSKEEDNNGTIEAAFDLKMIDKLKATVGIHYVLADDDLVKMKLDDAGNRNSTENYASIGCEYDYGFGKADALARVAWNPNETVGFYAGVGATYNLPAAWRVVADFRFQNERQKDDGSKLIQQGQSIGGLLGLEKELAGGCFGIGFELSTGNKDYLGPIQNKDKDKDSLIWAVPLRMEYRF